MTIEIEIQNSNLKSKIKIEKVSLTGNQNQNMRLERLAPVCVYIGEHIASLGAGLGALGAWVLGLRWPARPAACLGWQGRQRKGAELGHEEGRPPGENRP